MTPEELQIIRDILLADRERMMRNAVDERGDLRDREKWLLEKIEQALVRLNEGRYGLCEECEEEIGFARLKARPVATLCIDCKEVEERTEKTRLDPRTLEADEGGSLE